MLASALCSLSSTAVASPTQESRDVLAEPPKTNKRATSSSLQLAGQRVICSYPGQIVPQTTLDAISQGLCTGIIFFGDNLNKSDPSVLYRAVSQLNAANGKGVNAGSKLFLSTDQEGGQVVRLPGGPTQSAKQVGASADHVSAATKQGQTAAQALKVGWPIFRKICIRANASLFSSSRPTA